LNPTDIDKLNEFLYVQLYNDKGDVVDQNEYFFAPFRHLELPKAEIIYSIEELKDNVYSLKLESDFLALWVALELEGAEWDDNYINIYPKSARVLTFKAPYSFKEVEDKIDIKGYNLKRVRKS